MIEQELLRLVFFSHATKRTPLRKAFGWRQTQQVTPFTMLLVHSTGAHETKRYVFVIGRRR